jgi:hypothetical protein
MALIERSLLEESFSVATTQASTRGGKLIGFAESDSPTSSSSFSDSGKACSDCTGTQHENGSEISSSTFQSQAYFEAAG